MKKNFFILLAVSAFLSITIGVGIALSIKMWSQNHFSCNSNFVVIKENKKLSIMVFYNFFGDNGMVSIKGNLKENEETYSVSRTSYFSLSLNNGLYNAFSNSIAVSPADTASIILLSEMLPPFYIKKNNKLDFTISRDGFDGYIFSTGFLPSFYCKGSKK